MSVKLSLSETDGNYTIGETVTTHDCFNGNLENTLKTPEEHIEVLSNCKGSYTRRPAFILFEYGIIFSYSINKIL